MKAYKVTIQTPPMVPKKPLTVFNEISESGKRLAPHTREHPANLDYREEVRKELEETFDGAFDCKVRVDMEFYMQKANAAWVTNVANEMIKCLVPSFIKDHRHVTEGSFKIHYPPQNAKLRKQWKPRTELTLTPLEFTL